MVSGLVGFRRVRPGVYERTVDDPRQRKEVLRQLPCHSWVKMLVRGNEPVQRYREPLRVRVRWRAMNFMPRLGRTAWMSAEDMLSVWHGRAGRAGAVVRRPKCWLVRVYMPGERELRQDRLTS